MGKTLKEVISENHRKANLEYQIKLEKECKSEKKRAVLDTILGYLVGLFIVVISGFCIYLSSQSQKDFVDSCINQGYSKNYCIQHS